MMHRDNTEHIRSRHDLSSLEDRLWQVGFRLVLGRDREFYALPVHEPEARQAVRITSLITAALRGAMTPGGVAKACCRMIGLTEFEPLGLNDLGGGADA